MLTPELQDIKSRFLALPVLQQHVLLQDFWSELHAHVHGDDAMLVEEAWDEIAQQRLYALDAGATVPISAASSRAKAEQVLTGSGA